MREQNQVRIFQNNSEAISAINSEFGICMTQTDWFDGSRIELVSTGFYEITVEITGNKFLAQKSFVTDETYNKTLRGKIL